MFAFVSRSARAASFSFVSCAAVLLTGAVLAADLKPGSQGEPVRNAAVGNLRQQEHWVPFKADGTGPLLQARLTLPEGDGPWPGVLINHGAPRKPEDRARRATFNGSTTWFAEKGFAVLSLTRRGYGKSQGGYSEGYGKCTLPYYKQGGDRTAEDILVGVRYLRGLPNVIKDKIVVAGISAGGWGTLAAMARNPEGVVLGLNFAGGRGSVKEGEICGGEAAMLEAPEAWGKTARIPSFWIYAENDRFWGPDLPKKLFAAYRAGGAPAELWAAPAFPHHRDGHTLFGHAKGAGFWGERVERALRAVPGLMR